MTGLALGLPKLIISSSYSHRLMLHMLAQGLDHSVQVQVLSYPLKANRFRVWLMHCPGWTSALFAWGTPPLSTAPQAQHSALLTLHMVGLLHPCCWSFQWVSCLPPCLSSCAIHHSNTYQVFEKPYPSPGFSHPSQSSHMDFSTEKNMGLWEWIQRSHEADLRAGAPLLWRWAKRAMVALPGTRKVWGSLRAAFQYLKGS